MRLGTRDYEAVLDTIVAVNRAGDSTEFSQLAVERVARLVPSDVVTLNEVDPIERRVVFAATPSTFEMPAGAARILAEHADDHPIIRHLAETGDRSTHRISDFLTREQFHATALYALLYRSLGVEYQLAMTLAAPLPTVIGVAASRFAHDFSDREQALLELLRPHLAQAWSNARGQERLRSLLSAATDALGERDSGVIVLSDPLQELVPGTLERLARFFGPTSSSRALPVRVERWLTAQTSRAAAAAPPALRRPLTARHGEQRLTLHYVPPAADHPGAVLVNDAAVVIPLPRLETLGLSRREAEVVQLAIEGATNLGIAARLRLASGTVKKHLDNIYVKLGVRGRMELAALVHDMLRA